MTDRSSAARRTRRDVLSEWRQQELLDAACCTFARMGYASTCMEDIAKEAGIAKGTLYIYFESKEELFAAVLARDLERLTAKTIESMSSGATLADRLQVFLNLRLEFIRHNGDFLRVYLAEFSGRGSQSRRISEVIDELFSRQFKYMCSCLRKAIAQKEIRKVPVEAAAFAILDLAHGFAGRHLRNLTHLSLEEDLAFTHSLMLKGLQNA